MKKMMVVVLAMMMVLGTVAFADEVEFQRGQRMGLQLEGEELETFHEDMLAQKQDWIDTLVEEGKLTAAEGQAFMEAMKDNLDSCDGTSRQLGQDLNIGSGEGFGAMSGQRRGNGPKDGSGFGGRGRWQTAE